MKNATVFKSIYLGIILTVFINGCSINNESSYTKLNSINSNKDSQIRFVKSPNFDWKNKKIVVSFEDDFQSFNAIDNLGYKLSQNNLKQGITVKLKVVDFDNKSEKTTQIMIESFDLSAGINQFTVAYNNDKPYIIY
jgi:hypothetical protein